MVTEACEWQPLSLPSARGPDGRKLALSSDSQAGKRARRQESVGTQEQPDGRRRDARWRHSWVLWGGVNLGICCPRDVVISPQTLPAQVLPEWSYIKSLYELGKVCNLFWKNIKFVVFLLAVGYSRLNMSFKNAHYFVAFPQANFPWAPGRQLLDNRILVLKVKKEKK